MTAKQLGNGTVVSGSEKCRLGNLVVPACEECSTGDLVSTPTPAVPGWKEASILSRCHREQLRASTNSLMGILETVSRCAAVVVGMTEWLRACRSARASAPASVSADDPHPRRVRFTSPWRWWRSDLSSRQPLNASDAALRGCRRIPSSTIGPSLIGSGRRRPIGTRCWCKF